MVPNSLLWPTQVLQQKPAKHFFQQFLKNVGIAAKRNFFFALTYPFIINPDIVHDTIEIGSLQASTFRFIFASTYPLKVNGYIVHDAIKIGSS